MITEGIDRIKRKFWTYTIFQKYLVTIHVGKLYYLLSYFYIFMLYKFNLLNIYNFRWIIDKHILSLRLYLITVNLNLNRCIKTNACLIGDWNKTKLISNQTQVSVFCHFLIALEYDSWSCPLCIENLVQSKINENFDRLFNKPNLN